MPFVSGGRTIIGCDCYGLLYLAYTIELGIEIPSLADRYTDALDHDTVSRLLDEQLPLLCGDKLITPDAPCVAVIRIANRFSHVGVYVGEGLILHSRDPRNGSTLEHCGSPFFRGRIEGYYRVRETSRQDTPI